MNPAVLRATHSSYPFHSHCLSFSTDWTRSVSWECIYWEGVRSR
jgi:hypothetical protein